MSEISVHTGLAGADVPAGTLYTHLRRTTESATFVYDASYLARRGAYALDPQLTLTVAPHQTSGRARIFGAMSDCAPDRWGRTLINRREAAQAKADGRAARRLTEADYLLGVRDDLRQGSLRFRHADGPFVATDEDGVPALTDLPELLDLADRAERDEARLPDLERLVRVGSSLGGARPKAHVRTSEGRVAIAKFPSDRFDTWNVMAWEKVVLELAAAAGIWVPASQLLELAGRHVLVVDRFDRDASGRRIGYLSAMSMLEAGDGDRRSYVEIAEVIETCSAAPTLELEQLWRRIVLTVLCSNTDDHLRNHGFLHEAGDIWRLSPAFDMNPYPGPGPKLLATAIDPGDDEASLRLALSVAPRFRLDETGARRVLAEVVEAVRPWRQVAARWIAEPDIAAMAPAFAALDDVDGL